MLMGDTADTVDQGPTVGSLTIDLAGPQLRQAAADGRQALLNLAATRLGVPAAKLTVKDGVVSVAGDASRRVSYAELVDGRLLGVAIPVKGNGQRIRARARRCEAEARERVHDRRPVGAARRHPGQGDGRALLHPGRPRARDAARPRDPADAGSARSCSATGSRRTVLGSCA